MQKKVMINQLSIDVKRFKIIDSNPFKISFVFNVTHDTYHDVTTLLYENDFFVQVPEDALAFHATISQYSTSVTNLYEVGAVGEFTLELIEKE